MLTFSQRLKTTPECCHKPGCRYIPTHMTRAQSRGPGWRSRPGTPRKESGASKLRSPPTRCKGASADPSMESKGHHAPGCPELWVGVQRLEDVNAAAGPALQGRAEQTDSCPGGGSCVAFQAHQHLYKTACSAACQGVRGGGAGGGLPFPRPPTPPLPGLAPAESYWARRHLLGRGGMLPRAGRPVRVRSL